MDCCLFVLNLNKLRSPLYKNEETMKTLEDKTFAQFLDDNPTCMVMFGATWCGPCKLLKPRVAGMGLDNVAYFDVGGGIISKQLQEQVNQMHSHILHRFVILLLLEESLKRKDNKISSLSLSKRWVLKTLLKWVWTNPELKKLWHMLIH